MRYLLLLLLISFAFGVVRSRCRDGVGVTYSSAIAGVHINGSRLSMSINRYYRTFASFCPSSKTTRQDCRPFRHHCLSSQERR
ncbi:hypothetical protein DFH29DRAFT_960375 [Suillus ampliporus]|nr:hypothetical protein DFH29DRAFT_960375 [Suillus ampliporus]